ncbi:hypothetical protein WJX73_008115 [Symbiochloris irregularis]|uniref:Amino acid transporter n=1 Tax=Symbiochloris irregularis TaxID=706552 RepID=A0AAW1PB72_9CHLO
MRCISGLLKLTTDEASFAITLSIVEATNVIGNLQQCYGFGGPVVCVWVWVVVCFFTTFVGLSMAEIVSGLPTAGGPFFWASWLGGKHAPLIAWITGYLNLVGIVGVTASVAFDATYGAGIVLNLLCNIEVTWPQMFGVYAGLLVLAGGVNLLPTRMLTCVTALSLFWIIVTVISMVLLLPTVAPWHRPASFVFWTFQSWQQSVSGITSNAYLVLQGSLLCIWTFTGYEASAHMSEETVAARSATPAAIIMSLGASYIIGLLLIIVLLFCVQNPDNVLTGSAQGAAGYQIILDAFVARFGDKFWGVIFILVPLLGSCMSTIISIAVNSRMVYAFARDKGIPTYFSVEAFDGVISIETVGLQVSYGIPILCKMTVGRKIHEPGTFTLGRYSLLCNGLAVFWVLASMVPLMTPSGFPITLSTFNFAPVALALVLAGTLSAWYLPHFGARHWFKGHRHRPYLTRLRKIRKMHLKR